MLKNGVNDEVAKVTIIAAPIDNLYIIYCTIVCCVYLSIKHLLKAIKSFLNVTADDHS